MRIAFLPSMFLALMVGMSSAVHATPTTDAAQPVVATIASPDTQVMTINLNTCLLYTSPSPRD